MTITSDTTNPLLAKLKLPGSIYKLPSLGLLYTNNELDSSCSGGEVHVHPMSALDEITIKNPDLLFSGKAISEIFPNCVPEIKDVNNLFGKDIDALMLYLRIVTYGPTYEISFQHDCSKEAKQHTYSVNLEELVNKMKFIDPTTLDKLTKLKLPNGQIVKLQPLRYSHVIQILRQNENKRELTPEEIKQNILENMANLIQSVDDISDRNLIKEWITKLPATYANKIAKKVDDINDWGPDFSTTIICQDCKKELEIDVPTNPVNFYTE